MFSGLYDDRRAAQAAAYLLHLAGGSLEILKLTKLLYLSERLSYEKFGEPLTGDMPYAMKNGPVLSTIFDRTKKSENLTEEWRQWVHGRTGNVISRERELANPRKELRALSKADLKIMDETWESFGRYSSGQLVSYTHSHCAEWADPGYSSAKIDPHNLLRKVGLKREDADKQISHLREMGQLNREVDRHRAGLAAD